MLFRSSQEVTLRKAGSKGLFFDRWELVDPGLGEVYLAAPQADGLTVNGADVSVDDLSGDDPLPVFPGTYEITPTTGSSFLTYDTQDVTIGTDDDSYESVDFELAPTDDLLKEVSRQADAYLADCLAKTEVEPDGCPNQAYGYELKDVEWTLDQAPVYTLESDYDGGFRFETQTSGRATVTAKESAYVDGEPDEDFEDTDDLDLSGTVAIDGDTVTIQVDDYY